MDREVATTTLCLMCEVNVEHLLHILSKCTFVKQCWRLLGLNFDGSSLESASEWLLECLARETNEDCYKNLEYMVCL